MSKIEHPSCYGGLFPSTLMVAADVPLAGKAFWLKLTRMGGTYISARECGVDRDRWAECLDCPAFDSCYKLSMAQLALETAVAGK